MKMQSTIVKKLKGIKATNYIVVEVNDSIKTSRLFKQCRGIPFTQGAINLVKESKTIVARTLLKIINKRDIYPMKNCRIPVYIVIAALHAKNISPKPYYKYLTIYTIKGKTNYIFKLTNAGVNSLRSLGQIVEAKGITVNIYAKVREEGDYYQSLSKGYNALFKSVYQIKSDLALHSIVDATQGPHLNNLVPIRDHGAFWTKFGLPLESTVDADDGSRSMFLSMSQLFNKSKGSIVAYASVDIGEEFSSSNLHPFKGELRGRFKKPVQLSRIGSYIESELGVMYVYFGLGLEDPIDGGVIHGHFSPDGFHPSDEGRKPRRLFSELHHSCYPFQLTREFVRQYTSFVPSTDPSAPSNKKAAEVIDQLMEKAPSYVPVLPVNMYGPYRKGVDPLFPYYVASTNKTASSSRYQAVYGMADSVGSIILAIPPFEESMPPMQLGDDEFKGGIIELVATDEGVRYMYMRDDGALQLEPPAITPRLRVLTLLVAVVSCMRGKAVVVPRQADLPDGFNREAIIAMTYNSLQNYRDVSSSRAAVLYWSEQLIHYAGLLALSAYSPSIQRRLLELIGTQDAPISHLTAAITKELSI